MRTLFLFLLLLAQAAPVGDRDPFLSWSLNEAESIGKSTYVRGSVGSRWSERGLKTERAINYKLAATWFTPEVVRASARAQQLRHQLKDQETLDLLRAAEETADTVIMVELDPREGSGVIPGDWQAFLGPKGASPGSAESVIGMERSELRKLAVLAGTMQRNYDYDRFWVAFPLKRPDGAPLFAPGIHEAELVVRIGSQQGKVSWKIPDSIYQKMQRK
jgi:hypothetical protein